MTNKLRKENLLEKAGGVILSWADRRCTIDGVQRQAVRKDRSGKIDDAPAHPHF